MKTVTIVACALLVSACATTNGPRIMSASENGITYRVKSDQVTVAEDAAKEYCRTRGGYAVLDRVTPVGKYANVSFFCR